MLDLGLWDVIQTTYSRTTVTVLMCAGAECERRGLLYELLTLPIDCFGVDCLLSVLHRPEYLDLVPKSHISNHLKSVSRRSRDNLPL